MPETSGGGRCQRPPAGDLRRELRRSATRLQSVAKYLERMADHTTNLAEMVIFMIDGQDVRHQQSREEPGDGDQADAGKRVVQ